MPLYKVILSEPAKRQLDKLPDRTAQIIVSAIEELEKDPRPSGCKKLKGRLGYRIRKGDYRVVYNVEDSVLTVLVVSVAHRKDVYRR
jgi:mRNA interferase RelE/StbE